jgi:quercetin 2,3-dioxygenase
MQPWQQELQRWRQRVWRAHTFAQLSEKGKMLFFFQPSGKMEDYFRAIGKLTGPPSPEQGAKIFADHDMKVVGPPLTY